MIDELKLLDTAIKALTSLRDKNVDDCEYCEYLSDHIERLEQKQSEKILEYESRKDDLVPRITEKEEAYRRTYPYTFDDANEWVGDDEF